MREFFKPWRRRIGVVTLVMALAFVTGWARSFSGGEVLVLPIDNSGGFLLISGYGYFAITASPEIGNKVVVEQIPNFDWSDWQFFQLFLAISCWSIVFPLTLFSAYLLLSKPRKSNQTKTDEPTAVEGA